MSLTKTVFAAVAAVSLALPALAGEIMIEDAYARASTAMSKSGAAFMVIRNMTDQDDRLIAATSDVAQRVELHTHVSDANGVMKMMEIEEGFAIPAGGAHALQRGGDHVMFMGLNRPLAQGDVVTLTLSFEQAGDITVEVPVDLERQPAQAVNGMGGMKMGN
ncbi:copper chaperone PCu(A)C [Actibacterium sp. MT2.3-13A]|uniref:copper chaperone PCu(A)C n=1 Tax=Actibacterium sp. MT2.3-13A TaxID=2828332 RepID=UPI001BAE09BE|nr:copper chaperone PCu(A)C [Actibacterium sp. MT2.3-13A]